MGCLHEDLAKECLHEKERGSAGGGGSDDAKGLCHFSLMLEDDVVARQECSWYVGFADSVVGVAINHAVFDTRQDTSSLRHAQDLFRSGWDVVAELTGEHHSVSVLHSQVSPHSLLLPAHNVLGGRLAGAQAGTVVAEFSKSKQAESCKINSSYLG